VVKGQFFVITGIIVIITMSAIISYLVLPPGLKVSTLEFQRISLNKAYNLKGFLNKVSETFNWNEIKKSYRLKIEVQEVLNESANRLIKIGFDLRNDTDTNSLMVFAPKQKVFQVHWENLTAKQGVLYATLNYTGLANQTINVYYNSLSSQDYVIPSEETVNTTSVEKDGTKLIINTPSYLAEVDLNQGGVISSFKSKQNSHEWVGSQGFFNAWNEQESGTTTLSDYSSGPVFGYAKIYAYNFNNPASTPVFSKIEYFFFNDYVMANITIKNSTSTSGLDDLSILFNHACEHNWDYDDVDGGTISDFCSGASTSSASGTGRLWGLFAKTTPTEAKVFLTNISDWGFDSSQPSQGLLEASDVNDFTNITGRGSSSDQVNAIVYLMLGESLNGSKTSNFLLGHQFNIHVNDEESVNSKISSALDYLKVSGINEGYSLETSYSTFNEKIEKQVDKDDWSKQQWNRTSINLTNTGSAVENGVYNFSFSTSSSKDFQVPSGTINFAVFDQSHVMIPWQLSWEDESASLGNISLLVNLSANANNTFLIYYNADNSAKISFPTKDFSSSATMTNSTSKLNQVSETMFIGRIGFTVDSEPVDNATISVELGFEAQTRPTCIRVVDEYFKTKLTQPSFYHTGSSVLTTYFNGSLRPNFTVYNVNGTNFTVTVTNQSNNEVISFNVSYPDGSTTTPSNLEGNGTAYTIDSKGVSGEYNVSVAGSEWFNITSSLPKLVLNEKNFAVKGPAPKLLFRAGENDSFINMSLRLISAGSATTIRILDYEGNTLNSQSISQSWGELNFTGFKEPFGRFYWLDPTSLSAGAELEVLLSDGWSVSESKNYWFNPSNPRLNITFLNDFEDGKTSFFAYYSDKDCSDDQSSNLIVSGTNVSNSLWSWDFSNKDFQSEGANWFYDSGTFDIETRITDMSDVSASYSSALSSPVLTRFGKLFATVNAGSGTTPQLNYSFSISSYSPFIKIDAQVPVNASRIVEFSPRVRLNGSADHFWKVFGRVEGVLNDTVAKVSKSSFKCSNGWTFAGRRDNSYVFAVIVPCDLLIAHNSTASFKDDATESYLKLKLYPSVRENVFYLYAEKTGSWSRVEDFVRFLGSEYTTPSKTMTKTTYHFDNFEYTEERYQ